MSFDSPQPEDIWLALGRPVEPERDEYLRELISRAERKLRLTLKRRGLNAQELFDTDDECGGGYVRDLVIDAVARVERSAAVREGYKSESEGNYSYQVADARDAAAHLWWPSDELDLLGGTAPRATGVIGSIRLVRRGCC